MMGLPGWHPMVVHFPLALVVSATLFLLAARLLRDERHAATLATVGTWNLCVGAVAALFALGTGLAAVVDLHVGAAARQAISMHLRWAIFTTLALVLLAVWRGAGSAQDSRPSPFFLVVLIAATVALMVTGYRGGQNVYRYGIGVHGAMSAVLTHLTAGQSTVGELAEPFNISLPAISRHLRVLEAASLIVRERKGQHRVCRLDAGALGAASEWLDSYRRFWSESFGRLDQHLKRKKRSPK